MQWTTQYTKWNSTILLECRRQMETKILNLLIPDVPDRTLEPKPVLMVLVMDTAILEESTTQKCVVPSSSGLAAVKFQGPPYSVQFLVSVSLISDL